MILLMYCVDISRSLPINPFSEQGELEHCGPGWVPADGRRQEPEAQAQLCFLVTPPTVGGGADGSSSGAGPSGEHRSQSGAGHQPGARSRAGPGGGGKGRHWAFCALLPTQPSPETHPHPSPRVHTALLREERIQVGVGSPASTGAPPISGQVSLGQSLPALGLVSSPPE